MKHVPLRDGKQVPALGLGTWKMGESKRQQAAEVSAVRGAIQLGYRLIDTAEMYGEGGAETVVGEALRGALRDGEVKRDELFIVSKVYPHNASRRGAVAACERSLKRLGLESIDLYLLHWRGAHPLAETVGAFEQLQRDGRIVRWGVSNFDVDDMDELWSVDGGEACAANQVWYSAGQRGAEFDLLPWLQQHGVAMMAYSPIDQAALARHAALQAAARQLGMTAAQLALAWAVRAPGSIAIPKAISPEHQRDNLAVGDLTLDAAALSAIDAAFPPPKRKTGLAMN